MYLLVAGVLHKDVYVTSNSFTVIKALSDLEIVLVVASKSSRYS